MQVTDAPILDSILHPSDFSEASQVAFYHALKAALVAGSRLTLFHVSPSTTAEWSDFPGVRQTLERWGLLPPNSPRSAVPELGIDVKKVIAHERDPVASVLRYLERHPTDLIVLAPHQQDGRMRWLRASVSEPVARRSGQATLFVPHGVNGFVSGQDGSVSLQSILIPVAVTPRGQPAVAAAARLVSRLACPAGTFTVLHVGASGDMPALRRPPVAGWRWDSLTSGGEVVEVRLDLGVPDLRLPPLAGSLGRRALRAPHRQRSRSSGERAADPRGRASANQCGATARRDRGPREH